MQLTVGPVSGLLPHIKAGRLRALGVSSSTRAPAMPDVPTIAEAGVPGYEFSSWFGLFAPAGTPREVIARLQQEAAKAMAQPEVRERLPAMGNEAVGSTLRAIHREVPGRDRQVRIGGQGRGNPAGRLKRAALSRSAQSSFAPEALTIGVQRAISTRIASAICSGLLGVIE